MSAIRKGNEREMDVELTIGTESDMRKGKENEWQS